MTGRDDESPQGTQLISRAASLLRAIPRGSPIGRRLNDLAVSAKLPAPTARRILKALIREQFVSQDRRTRLYRLGPLAFELGLVANPQSEMIEACRPFVRDLARKTGDSSFLAIRSGTEIVCLDRANGDFPIRASMVDIGDRLPLGLGSIGVSLLSVLADAEIDEILEALAPRLYEYNGLTTATVRERLADTRKRGYADIPHQPLPAVRSIGLPVPTRADVATLGIATVAIESRFTLEHVQATVEALQICSRDISEMLAITIVS